VTKRKPTKKKTVKKKATKKCRKGIGGAPTLYKPEYCQQLIDFMSQGYSFRSFACDIPGVHSGTLHEWATKIPEFGEAKAKAQDKYFKYWEELGKRGVGGEVKNFNAVAWIFNMKNRFQWRNEVVVKDERKVESVTIELPSAQKQETITLNEGDWKDTSK
jgi:transposase